MTGETGSVRSRLKRRVLVKPLPMGLLAARAISATRRGSELAFKRRTPEKSYGRIGTLEVKMARRRSEIAQAQRLRYQVFYEEMSATPGIVARMRRRDQDGYDALCDHLLVVDRATVRTDGAWTSGRRAAVVGTYRVLRQEQAERGVGFYTQGEYDIAPLIRGKSPRYRFMELGRSCVLKPYRNKRTVELLWHGLWTYVREHKVDVMIGCASFEGTDPGAHAMALSFLHHHASATADWQCRAHPHLHHRMDLLPKSAVDMKAALKAMPPLIKGYLRLGAMIGDGAVIDRQFGTTDVLIILPVEKIDPRYFEHFGAPDEVKSRVAADV
ncbi:MAG: GNAT family N-acetyltransferase [Hyphomicrobium sp.]